MKIFIYKYFNIFLILFSILSLTSVTSLWWLSIVSIIFFIWNFFNEKKGISICIIFLIISILLGIFNFGVIKPAKVWGDKIQAEWDKTGYDSIWKENAQQSINIINEAIEEYKFKNAKYPESLDEIQDIMIINRDYSYRIKQSDGQTSGIPFYYKKVDSNKFYLAGVGKDGIYKTDDDLLPQISLENEKTTGLVRYVIKSFSAKEIYEERKVMEMFRKAKNIEKEYGINK